MEKRDQLLQKVWYATLFIFLVAALTGLLYRWGLVGGDTFGLRLPNVRHAHSHLMFFNWVTPIPMAFIARHLLKFAPESYTQLKWTILGVIGVGLTSYPFFLLYGYHPVTIGEASLPFSVILSGFVMIGWYWFIAIYLRHRDKLPHSLSRLFYEGAMAMLVVSSLGAWGVAVTQFGNIGNNLISGALTHFFLTVFTEGWCILAALGILYEFAEFDKPVSLNQNWLIAPIVLGVPLMFPFGLSADLLSSQLLWVARFGSLAVSVGLILNVYMIFKSNFKVLKKAWAVVGAILVLKVLMQLGAVVLPSILWLGEHGLRVLYLHVLLLGFVSTLFFTAYHSSFLKQSGAGLYLFIGSVFILIGTLVLISGVWPPAWAPSNVYQWVTIGALLPSVAIAAELGVLTKWYLFR